MLANTAELLDQMPRDVEFTYNKKMDKLKPLITDIMVPYAILLKNLHKSKAHFQGLLPICPPFCRQKKDCHRIRETKFLVKLIVGELGKKNKVFKKIKISMIGSTKEGSRAYLIFVTDTTDGVCVKIFFQV